MGRKSLLIIGLILVAVAIIGGGFLWWTARQGISPEPSPTPTPMASPTATSTLSPVTGPIEEEESDLEQIKEAFAEKYNKPLGDITLTIDENTGTYANGGVKFAGEIGGAWWLAFNDGSGWVIVADGNGSVMCADIEDYNFPVSMVPECWDEATNELIKF